jgi:DNA-binding XRE family transcriptional regulator
MSPATVSAAPRSPSRLHVKSDGRSADQLSSTELIERLNLGDSPMISEVEILRRGTVSEYSDIITNYVNVCIYRNYTNLLSCLNMSTDSSGTQSKGPFRIYTPASLGDAIRHYRTEAGLTQAELAERAGLHRSYLSELETGKETEQVKRILRVLRQLGVRMTLDKADW